MSVMPAQLLRRNPVSILHKSIAGRYRPVRVADGPITGRYRFINNASWEAVNDIRRTRLGLRTCNSGGSVEL